MFICSFLSLIILCYRISCCFVLQRHILKKFSAGTVKSHTFHGVGLSLCMKIWFISTFLQYVIVQMVASSWCAFVIWKLFYNCLKTSVPINLGRTKKGLCIMFAMVFVWYQLVVCQSVISFYTFPASHSEWPIEKTTIILTHRYLQSNSKLRVWQWMLSGEAVYIYLSVGILVTGEKTASFKYHASQ
jgi:hypothetical protein